MHPEVKYIGLLMLLYSGTTYNGFKYSILSDTVKKLKQISKSVGNDLLLNHLNKHILLFSSKIGTSETLCNKITVENIKQISNHVPTHIKPTNDTEMGHYLAGLIDGDGNFSSKQQLVITFNSLDISLAYFIKKQIGYGSVYKVKNKNAIVLVIAAKKGLETVINLINGKLRSKNKFKQISKNILNNIKYLDFNRIVSLKLNTSDDLKNLWLAGFSDAYASFQIKLISRNNKTEVRLNYQIDQKENYLLIFIKNFIGGNIGFIIDQDTYYYGSTSFGSAKNVINYFDHYNLLSSKYINYLKWRKAYIIIQKKNHLSHTGIAKILKLKNTMNRFNDKTVI